MKRKIMITLDGSDLSRKVMPSIRRLFPTTDTELILLQVIDPLTYSPYVTPMAPSLTWDPQLIEHEWVDHRRIVIEQMNEMAHELESEGFHVRIHIPVGDPIKEICAVAKQEEVDLLAMATHGRTGLKRLLLGSVAEGVLRATSLPVLLIHPEDVKHPQESGKEQVQVDDEAHHLKSRKSEVVYETPSV